MDLFLKIAVLQANFCWLGDLEINNMSLERKCCWENENPTEGLNFAPLTTPPTGQ